MKDIILILLILVMLAFVSNEDFHDMDKRPNPVVAHIEKQIDSDKLAYQKLIDDAERMTGFGAKAK